MSPDLDKWMVNLRWITPLAISIVGILVTILIFMVGNQATENRAIRIEITETRNFAVQYTDRMIELLLKTNDRKK